MKTLFRLMAVLTLGMCVVGGLTACGDGNKGSEPDVPDAPSQNQVIDVNETDIEGTWRFTADDYGNIDYISFNGAGKGMMAYVSDLYQNEGIHSQGDGASELVRFTYNIEKNVISVFPEVSNVMDFTITVYDISHTSFDVLLGGSFIYKRRVFKRYDNDWEWFTKEGPASIDLTDKYVGTYAVDSDPVHKLQAVKVNNYTITIKDLYKGTSVTGYLYWHEIYNNKSSDKQVTLWNLSNPNIGNSYYFTVNGGLKCVAGPKYFSGTAYKIGSDGGGDDNDDKGGSTEADPYENSPIVGSWKCSAVDGDKNQQITLILSKDGSAKEIIYDYGDKTTYTGEFEYSDRTLYWHVSDGIMENTFGWSGITVKTLTSTQMVLTNGIDSMTFKKI